MPDNLRDYISDICLNLNLSSEVVARSTNMIDQITNKDIINRHKSKSIAAAVVYIGAILCGESRTQREVADVSEVSEVTIRQVYKILAKNIDVEISI